MTPETRSLLTAVLALPNSERVLLLDELLGPGRPAGFEELDDESLEAELDRRYEEYRRDPSTAVPWSEIRRPR